MIKNFLILNCIGQDNTIGLRVDKNFYIHVLDQKVNNNDQLVMTILNLIKKHKVNFDNSFSVLVNIGPGSFSSIRIALAAAKGIKISKKIDIFGFKNEDLSQFSLVNIEILIKKKLLQKKLIKPIYLS